MLRVRLILFTLILMISFPIVNAVLFTPALPAIGLFFSLSKQATQVLMPAFLFGYALSQLIYAPVSNYYGRKSTLYIGIILQIVSSLLCILSGQLKYYPLLLISRFMLAMGSGVGLNMTFTLVNEYFKPAVAASYISYIMLGLAVMPALGLAMGGFLNSHFGWQSCYYACTCYGIILLVFVSFLPETMALKNKRAIHPKIIYQTYKQLFSHPTMMTCGLLMGCSNAFVYVFATLAPFLSINVFKMSSTQYGYSNLLPSLGLALGLMLSAKLCKRYLLRKIIFMGILIILMAVILLTVNLYLNLHPMLSLFTPMTVLYVGLGLTLPNLSSLSMKNVTDKPYASAVISFMSIIVSACLILLMGFIHAQKYSLPVYYFLICGAMVVIFKTASGGQGRSAGLTTQVELG